MNIELSEILIQKLVSLGVKDFVVCAGARNAPLVKVLAAVAEAGLSVNYFFDERAAGFFALGRSRREARPTAVVTTSGTAVAELLPAAVESYYSGVPLVFVTADRPAHYRGSGAPQSIQQVGIFSNYVSHTFDFSSADEVSQLSIDSCRATHINVCFAEPLIDRPIAKKTTQETAQKMVLQKDIRQDAFGLGEAERRASVERIRQFLTCAKRPLVVVSELSDNVRSSVFEVLRLLQAPIYTESQSNLRDSAELEALSLRSGAHFFSVATFREQFDSVLRLGSVPTLRLWRDLEDKLLDVPVLSVSDLPFSGLARDQSSAVSFSDFLNLFQSVKFNHAEAAVARDRLAQKKLEMALQDLPQSEPSWMRAISDVIPRGSLVMLGNSLPIREWDLAANYKSNQLKVFANRGANGIDGLISTFLGLAQPGKENWLILGDLSALYDLNGLSLLHALPTDAWLRIVVINNRGGQIFKPMFNDKNFLNEHNFEFSKWAEMFGLKYMKFAKVSERKRFKLLTPENFIIEIQPDSAQSEEFWGRI